MIDVKELRAGNWIQYDDGTPVKVFSIDAYRKEVGVERFPQPLSVSVLQPIPLSPELLEACGFEKKDYVYEGGSVASGFLNSKFFIRFIPEAGGYCCEYFPYKQSHNCLPGRMNYLHQLQNNYFWWTSGTELTVNLQKVKV